MHSGHDRATAEATGGDSQCLDLAVLWRLNLGHGIHARKHLVGHRIVDTVVAVFDVLLGQGPCGGHLVAVGALGAALALALHEEGADGRTVALVVRRRALHLQDLVVRLRLCGGQEKERQRAAQKGAWQDQQTGTKITPCKGIN